MVCNMPALWQSSQRPMYVRTVWVDGFRHAILSHDDPYLLKARKKRPHSSVSWKRGKGTQKRGSLLSRHDDESDDCLSKLDLVITCDKSNIICKQAQEPDIEKLNLTELEQDSEEDFVLRATPQQLNEFESCRSKFNSLCLNMRTLRTNRTDRPEGKSHTDLSDRVLQWLDLAGKVDLLAPENAERMANPRHSWPEIQKRNLNLTKSKTTVDLRGKDNGKTYSPKTGEVARTQQYGYIDRHDFYVPTSANTIEEYARQSRHARGPPNVNAKAKEQNKSKTKDLRANVLETRHKVAAERNAVQKQYAELVSKKIIPDLGKSSKKQVHIFMPDMPKKTNSSIASRTESLLSQRIEILNK